MKTMELLKKFKNLAIFAALEMLSWSVPAGSRRSQVRNWDHLSRCLKIVPKWARPHKRSLA